MQNSETVIIVAHPDDEILWFASALSRADRVVLAFGPLHDVPSLGAARDNAVAELPFPFTFLKLKEAGSYAKADWNSPTENSIGMELPAARSDVREAYEANFFALRDHLRRSLHAEQTVFSHNPWGEYGHEDHVLVFRVVDSLRREIGFQHWVPAYVSDRSATLAKRWQMKLGSPSAAAAVDPKFTTSIKEIYQKHMCWTWDSDWIWPPEEWFFEMNDHGEKAANLSEIKLINVVRSQTVAG